MTELIQTPFESGLLRARIGALVQLKRKLEDMSRRQKEMSRGLPDRRGEFARESRNFWRP